MTAETRSNVSIKAAVGTQGFANEQRALLDLIDKLQFAQLDNIRLPQIAVVGDQSAGKSSVLEAITGIPFPRDKGACTRFATEVRLRRADQESLKISIIPASTRSYAEQDALKSWAGTVNEFTNFDTMMRQATELIAPKNVPGRFATEDVLVVEKRGPDMPLLTVVDLPGLVQIPNPEQSLEDITAINDLTEKYMKSSRTIILAVVGGNQDYVQAPILAKTRRFDPNGKRSIGVLTKPDVIDFTSGLDDKFIDLVMNKDSHNYFSLGWYVLRNPSHRKPGQPWPTTEERQQVEDDFFSHGKWGSLPSSMCGVAALRQKLSTQLQRHIGKHVPSLQREIQKAFEDCETELKSLGTGKDTVEEMKEELAQLCSDSNDLVTPAVQGTYINPPGQAFFPRDMDNKDTPVHNLRARVVEENVRFAERVRTQGQNFRFSSAVESGTPNERKSKHVSKKDFARMKVGSLLRQNVGTEFPKDYNPRHVYTLFQGHSQNWNKLAQEHKNNVGVICNQFLAEIIDYIWPHRMHNALHKEFLDSQITDNMAKAQEQVELLAKDLHFEIQPYDPEYEERLEKWRTEAMKEGIYSSEEELLEKMLIYYELSAKTFTKNVITQVVERHLLQGLRGVFHWIKIMRMNEATVKAIAAENEATSERRRALKARKIAIEESRNICASIAMIKELRVDDQDESDSADESSDTEANVTPRSSGQRESTSARRRHDIVSTSQSFQPQLETPVREPSKSTLSNMEYGREDVSPTYNKPKTPTAGSTRTATAETPMSLERLNYRPAANELNAVANATMPVNTPTQPPPPPPRRERPGQNDEFYPLPATYESAPRPSQSYNQSQGNYTPMAPGYPPPSPITQHNYNVSETYDAAGSSAKRGFVRKMIPTKG